MHVWRSNGCHIDNACGSFKHPVPTQRGIAGGIGTGRHIGTGSRCQSINEGCSSWSCRYIAAVDQEVGVGGQAVLNGLQVAGIGSVAERGNVEGAAGQVEFASAAMTDEVNGFNAALSLQGSGHL